MSISPTKQCQNECQVSILRAGSIGDNHPPKLTIEAHEQIHALDTPEETRVLYLRQGTELADALLASLPGGTIDVLLAELMRRRASMFSVPL